MILRVIKDIVIMMHQVKGLNPAAMDIEVLELGGISVPNPVELPILELGLSGLKIAGGVPFSGMPVPTGEDVGFVTIVGATVIGAVVVGVGVGTDGVMDAGVAEEDDDG